ncbi:MAG: integrase DNA-binding domain-containing protein [Ruminococcus sp.]|nr:integrase DNA-binding domain-containing protein [Ruminococcus sp.]
MSEKRRDRKNRILKDGECQKRDGRYRFCYTDIAGNKKELYSWRLDKNDPHPEDKKKDLSLREKELKAANDILGGVLLHAKFLF